MAFEERTQISCQRANQDRREGDPESSAIQEERRAERFNRRALTKEDLLAHAWQQRPTPKEMRVIRRIDSCAARWQAHQERQIQSQRRRAEVERRAGIAAERQRQLLQLAAQNELWRQFNRRDITMDELMRLRRATSSA
mmetsp:Transcript_125919/g.402460  ORF Transcript_125919/g.402460 Transcript_125919/m.402460 type:complete len:139 (+) Transcript_125919:652-1068(+)